MEQFPQITDSTDPKTVDTEIAQIDSSIMNNNAGGLGNGKVEDADWDSPKR